MTQSQPTQQFTDFLEKFLFDAEGRAWENDSNDTGNVGTGGNNEGTKFGVDAASHPGVDVKYLTEQQAAQIYWNQWTEVNHPLAFPTLPPLLGYFLFDCAVNLGDQVVGGVEKGGEIFVLQWALQRLNYSGIVLDGVYGPITQVAFTKELTRGKGVIFGALVNARVSRYRVLVARNPRLQEYLVGWVNRVNNLQAYLMPIYG